MTTAADTLAPHFAAIARQLGRIADALEARSTSHSPKKAPVAENSPSRVSPTHPDPADAPEWLKRRLWQVTRDRLGSHRYIGAHHAACTCRWTHPNVVDPVGEWLDHVTDVILAELGLS